MANAMRESSRSVGLTNFIDYSTSHRAARAGVRPGSGSPVVRGPRARQKVKKLPFFASPSCLLFHCGWRPVFYDHAGSSARPVPRGPARPCPRAHSHSAFEQFFVFVFSSFYD